VYDLLVVAAHGLVTELPATLVAAALGAASGRVVRAWRRRMSKPKTGDVLPGSVVRRD
jgi:hypothetical protein